MAKYYSKIKPVHVNAYNRFRFGKWERVGEYWRSYPNR